MTLSTRQRIIRRKAVWGPKRTVAFVLLLALGLVPGAFAASGQSRHGSQAVNGRPNSFAKAYKLDDELQKRSRSASSKTTRVIVELQPGATLPPEFKRLARRHLGILNGDVLDVSDNLLSKLAANPGVFRVHYDRPTQAHNYRTTVSTGARAARSWFGLTGAGVGVAVIDSGIAAWHDDLTGAYNSAIYPYGNQRVEKFVDFINGATMPYDDNGHGTHVAGIIAGNGYDSSGLMAGVAPQARLVSLKVLDAAGQGTISDIIAALDWVAANHAAYNIRVVNLSIGASVNESYWTDPLTLAAKRVVDDGVVVVAAAGNFGKGADGQIQYGSITAPGNAPWVLTVGASSTNGTVLRQDDTIPAFSSRGPTYLDWAAKPDLVAPGTGTESLAAPGSTLYANDAQYLLAGTRLTANKPYLVLSGTSMAAPAVAGTVALMLQANPNLTPNAVKAILEYTAQTSAGYDALTQGAGFLNTLGATRLAIFFGTAQPGDTVPVQPMWGQHLIWGNELLSGGVILPDANAWSQNIVWGSATTPAGANIVWGSACGADCGNVVWGSSLVGNIVWGSSLVGDNIVWGNSVAQAANIVWGSACGGADCDDIVWGSLAVDNVVWGNSITASNIVWGSSLLDNIVWGANGTFNIVWGSSALDNIVWGSSALNNIVWGSSALDNIVWGSAGEDNIVWGSSGLDNIVWGSSVLDNIVWGSSLAGNIVWGSSVGDNIVWGDSGGLAAVWRWRLSEMPSDGQLLGVVPAPLLTAATDTTTDTTTTTSVTLTPLSDSSSTDTSTATSVDTTTTSAETTASSTDATATSSSTTDTTLSTDSNATSSTTDSTSTVELSPLSLLSGGL